MRSASSRCERPISSSLARIFGPLVGRGISG
jgi:hypothetical protein